MAQWVLKANENVVPRCILHPLTIAEENSEREVTKKKSFDGCIQMRWDPVVYPSKRNVPDIEMYSNDDESPSGVPELDDLVDSEGYLMNQQP
eukprot:248169-Ditylum_brightwellii.AAC.1